MNTKTLQELAISISSGLTPLRSNPKFWTDGTIPWLKTEQLGEKFIYETSEKISKNALTDTSIKINPINTLSIAMYGEGRTRGNLSILKNKMTTNQACCNVYLDPNLADYEYVFYYLKTQYFQLRNLASGVRKNLNSNDIKNFEIKIPENLKDQQKIAAVLSTLDAKIELNNRINAELEAMAKLLYDYWFVQFNFPDENGNPYKSSGGKMVYNAELKRKIPAGWEVGSLDGIGQIVGGSTPSTTEQENFSTKGIPWITPKDLSLNVGSKYISKGEIDVTELGLKSASLKLYPKGTVLLSSRAPIGYMAIARNPLTTNQGFKSFIPNKGFSTEYIFYSVKSVMKSIIQYSSGSTFKEISGSVLKTIKLPLPEQKFVIDFSEKMKPLLDSQNTCEQETHHLTQLRDFLLPMLMNGQVSVI